MADELRATLLWGCGHWQVASAPTGAPTHLELIRLRSFLITTARRHKLRKEAGQERGEVGGRGGYDPTTL